MNTHVRVNRRFKFHFPDLNTMVLVEKADDAVIIRASRNSFSDARKECFIRELAAEGFIAEGFQWSCRGIRWLIDDSLAMPSQEVRARANRFMVRLGLGAVILWIGLMAVAVLHGGHAP